MKLFNFIKNWALLFSILIGVLCDGFLPKIGFTTPYLLFIMLSIAFCKISPKEISFRVQHLYFLIIQVCGGVLVYFLLKSSNVVFAESMMMCLLCPTATASSVVTIKLGGNGSTNISYVLISSLMVSVLAPLLFPIIHPSHAESTFIADFWKIFSRVAPLLIGPFFCANLLKLIVPKFHGVLANKQAISFYMWVSCLAIAAAQTSVAIKAQENSNTSLSIAMLLGSAVLCFSQFFLGKYIGGRFGDKISGGQSLGQKNTILAMWIAQSYLFPLSLLGLGCYILWQNIFNSWQLYRLRKSQK